MIPTVYIIAVMVMGALTFAVALPAAQIRDHGVEQAPAAPSWIKAGLAGTAALIAAQGILALIAADLVVLAVALILDAAGAFVAWSAYAFSKYMTGVRR